MKEKENGLINLVKVAYYMNKAGEHLRESYKVLTIEDIRDPSYVGFNIEKLGKYFNIREETYVQSSLTYKDININLHQEISNNMRILKPVLKEVNENFEKLTKIMKEILKDY